MIGVVIGRFQVANLHEGHIALLAAVSGRCERMVVLVGCSNAQPNAYDPLPFFCRADAIRSVFPQATVLPLNDHATDAEWSAVIDRTLEQVGGVVRGPFTLFCGRDHSLGHYAGRWPVTVLTDIQVSISGTEVRSATELGYSYDFRAGMVFAAKHRFPTSFQTVDIAVRKGDTVLLGRKHDGLGWRFPGGFVDPADASLEAAARRELREECGLFETTRLTYLGSHRVEDWRYRSSPDAILTAFFECAYVFGAVAASDDLVDVAFLPLSGLDEAIAPVHRPLVRLLSR